MPDFKFVYNQGAKKYVILDPNRAKRPNIGHKVEKVCPFCVGIEKTETEIYRVGGSAYDTNWQIRVIENKFPFAPIHEIIIHSPDHHKNYEELPLAQVELIFKTYRERYIANEKNGTVYIFHNRGIPAGESIPHPHTQVTVVPKDVALDIPYLDMGIYKMVQKNSKFENPNPKQIQINKKPNSKHFKNFKIRTSDIISNFVFRASNFNSENSTLGTKFEHIETDNFIIYCPADSQWPDEVWIAPKEKGRDFGQISEHEISDLAFCVQRIISIFDLKLGHEFPFNHYIYPGKNWYMRIIPRTKILGGFEAGTGIIVNTQDPKKTFILLKDNFFEPNLYKIRLAEGEDFWRSV